MYVQVPCMIPTSRWKARMLYALMGSCLTVFVYLFTLVFFDYLKTIHKVKYVEWDVKTITAGDYTVEFDLKRSTYEHWKEHYFDSTNFLSESAQFKYFI